VPVPALALAAGQRALEQRSPQRVLAKLLSSEPCLGPPTGKVACSKPLDVAEPRMYAQGRGPRQVIGSPTENPAGCHGTMASCWALVQSRQAHSDRKVGVRA
jgi:hypothetical protein